LGVLADRDRLAVGGHAVGVENAVQVVDLVGDEAGGASLEDGDTALVRSSVAEVDGKFVEGPPKSAAGRRDVAIPEVIVTELRAHLDEWSEPGADGRVFVGPRGGVPRRTNFQATWREAIDEARVPGLHFHDLRHTGNMLAAESASLRELMARMGHSSTRAALIYQHASRDRERAIGAAISARVEADRSNSKGHVGGTTAKRGEKPTPAQKRRKRP
jgi:Phage integrase family